MDSLLNTLCAKATPLTITLLLGILFLTYQTISTLLLWYRLRKFPGPRLAAFSYLWQIRTDLSGRMGDIFLETAEQYGPVARIGPRELLVGDPAILRRITSARATYTRGSWYADQRLDPYTPNMVNLTDTAEHDRMKARILGAYSGRDNASLEGDIDGVVVELVDRIRDGMSAEGTTSRWIWPRTRPSLPRTSSRSWRLGRSLGSWRMRRSGMTTRRRCGR
jgi:hypothetical protein